MASDSGTIYTGVTGDLEGRVFQHKKFEIPGFIQRYKCYKLVYFEEYEEVEQAILRESNKKWSRFKKKALIKHMNPSWRDLTKDWKVKGTVIPRPNRPRDLLGRDSSRGARSE